MFALYKHRCMIKTGILGTSTTAGYYAETLRHSNSFELTGCYSPDYEKSKQFGAHFNLVAYPSMEALYKYADALIVTDFAPDFLGAAEKSLKNFKHILIANPFLAALNEIQYLKKLSEESNVVMQIAGGQQHRMLGLNEEDDQACYFAEIHRDIPDLQNKGFQCLTEALLTDVSILLKILKGTPKRVISNAWNSCNLNPNLISIRIELDTCFAASLLLNGTAEKSDFRMSIYGTNEVTRVSAPFTHEQDKEFSLRSASFEMEQFETGINAMDRNLNSNTPVFQALEIVHSVKDKILRNITSDIQVS